MASALFVNYGNIAQQARNGRLKIVGVAIATRSPFPPDMPTIHELGVKGISTNSWFGFLGLRNLPPAIVEREVAAILQKTNAVELFKIDTLDTVTKTPDRVKQLIADHSQMWAAKNKLTGAKLD